MTNVLDPDFLEDCFYEPGGVLIDEILEIDKEKNFVRARMPTSAVLPITAEQKAHPVRHPSHVSGGLLVHMTGVMGYAHFYYCLGLRHRDGWIGYGVRIHNARFSALANTTDPLILDCWAAKTPRIRDRFLLRYKFEFRQGETIVYEGDQTAIWMKTKDAAGTPL